MEPDVQIEPEYETMEQSMRVRSLRLSDIPILQEMASASGFPYPEIPSRMLEAVLVVVDDDDQPIMACACERIVQTYLWSGKLYRLHAQAFAIRLLTEEMRKILRRKGYNWAEAFVPPTIAGRFGRLLERKFGWVKNWPSWSHPV